MAGRAGSQPRAPNPMLFDSEGRPPPGGYAARGGPPSSHSKALSSPTSWGAAAHQVAPSMRATTARENASTTVRSDLRTLASPPSRTDSLAGKASRDIRRVTLVAHPRRGRPVGDRFRLSRSPALASAFGDVSRFGRTRSGVALLPRRESPRPSRLERAQPERSNHASTTWPRDRSCPIPVAAGPEAAPGGGCFHDGWVTLPVPACTSAGARRGCSRARGTARGNW